MATSKSLEARYPTLTRFVNEIGRIEIGVGNYMISSFVAAYDEGGTVYEGQDEYPSLDAALQDLDAGIKEYLDELGI
ncbi:MAG: hypothetical protein HC852_22750 [Acaryochloridaceae cyanobacterium RU_4_10]|nr:hypothetical protein [Acaryochloridaceae cyanobacterium RU_4_10]